MTACGQDSLNNDSIETPHTELRPIGAYTMISVAGAHLDVSGPLCGALSVTHLSPMDMSVAERVGCRREIDSSGVTLLSPEEGPHPDDPHRWVPERVLRRRAETRPSPFSIMADEYLSRFPPLATWSDVTQFG